MCGICGFWGKGTQQDIEEMNASIAHRGPDASDTYSDLKHQVHLGHRRLSILDIKGGAQPMWSHNRSVCIVFNGEIYNHGELRLELEAKGHHFQSDHSDTEVLIYGYLEWKEKLPEKLNGMFAFAIWDVRDQSLFLARDRFGEKPLYWGNQNGIFAFGSELGTFQHHRSFDIHTNELGLQKFLAYGFIPAPQSFYKNIFKLPAGHWMRVTAKGTERQISRYWSYDINPTAIYKSDQEAAEELLYLLDQSVKRRLISDVPLGVFLSGGIDSSSIAALAQRHTTGNTLKTFSIGFKEKSFDESAFSQLVATRIGSEHSVETVCLENLRSLSEDVLQKLDEPMADPSLIPTFALCQMTRKHVSVALSGDGGDELFAGYDTFSALKLANFFEKYLPNLFRKGALSLASLLPRSNKNMSLEFKIRRALGGLGNGPACWNPQWLAPANSELISDLLHSPLNPEELYQDAITHWGKTRSKNLIDRSSEYYVRFYLQDDILTKVDRAAMLNSLETRAIFLDNDLVEFARTLPANYKMRGNNRKYILKKAVKDLLPREILDRPKKGFGIPLADWVGHISLNQDRISRFGIDPTFIDPLFQSHKAAQQDHRYLLWCFYTLQHHQLNVGEKSYPE